MNEIIINDPVEMSYDDGSKTEETEPAQFQQNKQFTELLIVEVKRLATISKHYKQRITESKTNAKKRLYTKKLGKNNKKLSDMLMRLDQLSTITESNTND